MEWLRETVPLAALTPSGTLEATVDSRAETLVLTLSTEGLTAPTRRFEVEVRLALREIDASRVRVVAFGDRASVTLYALRPEGFTVVRRSSAPCTGGTCPWEGEVTDTLGRYDLVFRDETTARRIAREFRRVGWEASSCVLRGP
ncbi:hypothetical protein [Archangium primigenium]|uniref:hypothetical protein n=1 Tax=[Archangium] primigenium TaxID=2792470 RepID=UPI001957CDE6|nr:hypothetical protein [Archangium primigenium]MBM7118224.1 hypothetical protein [Archangium primigenium]